MKSIDMELTRPADAAPARRMAKQIRPERANQAGRPTAAELDLRKARVMEVATELFVRGGYAETSLVDIAKSAGVATRTLYQHFGDKEALFHEVIYARDSGVIIPPPTLQPDDTVRTALAQAGRYALEVALRQRSIDLMRLMVAESNRFPELMRKVATATFARFRRNVGKLFEGLALAGLIPDGDHARSAELFVDLVLGNTPIMTYTNWELAPPTAEDLAERVDLFILGRFGSTLAEKDQATPAKIHGKRALSRRRSAGGGQ